MPPRKSSIKRKIMAVIMLASITVLLVTVAAFMAYDLVTFPPDDGAESSHAGADNRGNSTAAVAFRNEDDAANVLLSLRTRSAHRRRRHLPTRKANCS